MGLNVLYKKIIFKVHCGSAEYKSHCFLKGWLSSVGNVALNRDIWIQIPFLLTKVLSSENRVTDNLQVESMIHKLFRSWHNTKYIFGKANRDVYNTHLASTQGWNSAGSWLILLWKILAMLEMCLHNSVLPHTCMVSALTIQHCVGAAWNLGHDSPFLYRDVMGFSSHPPCSQHAPTWPACIELWH